MPTPAEYAEAWARAREEYAKTGRRPVKVYMTSVPLAVKMAARSALSADVQPVEVDVVLRRLADQEKVSASVIRRAFEHCASVDVVGPWAKLAFAGLPVEQKAPQIVLPSAPQVKATGEFNDGIMICLKPADEVRAALAVDGGVAVDDIHVTLAYLGKVGQDGNDQARFENIEQAVRLYAQEAAPLSGEVAGTGAFRDTGDGAPCIALVDVPGLNGWREALIRNVANAGGVVAENHGYTPHITLGYNLTGEPPVVAGMPLHFESIYLVWGEDWHAYPLEGDFTGLVTNQYQPSEEKSVRRVRTVEGMRLYDLPMGAIIVRDPGTPAPALDPRALPPTPYVGPGGKQPTSADKTGDTEKAKAAVKSVEQRIAEGVDPGEAAKAYKKELHAARLRIQRARRKQEELAAKAVAEDQKLDAGHTVKDATADEIVQAAQNGELASFVSKPGEKAKALYGGGAVQEVVGTPELSDGAVYSSAQMATFAALKGPGFVAKGTSFYDVLQHDTADGEYLPVMHVPISGGYVVPSGWAMRRNGITYLIESAHADDAGEPSAAAKQRLLKAATTYQKVLSALPADKRALQRGVALLHAPNPKDAYWAEQYKMPGFQSYATGGRGGTYFWNANDPSPATAVHEFGHNVDSQAFQALTWVSTAGGPVLDGQTMSWANAALADQKSSEFFLYIKSKFTATRVDPHGHAILFGSTGVSDYGDKAPKEDFAESVRLYLKDKREGKLGFIKEDSQQQGTNIRFADVWPERARILDLALGLETDYDTAFHKRQVERLTADIKGILDNADEIKASPADYGRAFGLSESDALNVITAAKQAKLKELQLEQLTDDLKYAMQTGVVPPGADDSDEAKASTVHAFTGGVNDANNALTHDDLVTAFNNAAVAHAAWKAKYNQNKLDIWEAHLAAAKLDPTSYSSGAALYEDDAFSQLSTEDRLAMANTMNKVAKKFALDEVLSHVQYMAPDPDPEDEPGLKNWMTGYVKAAPALKVFQPSDEEYAEWIDQGVELAQAAYAAKTAAEAKNEAAVNASKMTAEAAQAQAALMDINDLPKELGQKIRKRKAFIKYKAKQPQKIVTTAEEFWDGGAATFSHWQNSYKAGSPGDAIALLNDAFVGKTVTMKAAPGYTQAYYGVPKGKVTITEVTNKPINSYSSNEILHLAYTDENGVAGEIRSSVIAAISTDGPGLPDDQAQKLADEYERKAVSEALVAKLMGTDVTLSGNTVESNDPTKLRKFKEGTRRKGNAWLKRAGVISSVAGDPGSGHEPLLDGMDLGWGPHHAAAQRAKQVIGVQIAERLNNAEAWSVFQEYAKTYGIGSGHTGSRSKPKELKAFADYTPLERRKILYGEVSYRVRRWAGTSGDSQVGPLMVQKAVQEEFGLDSDYKARLISSNHHYDAANKDKIIEGVEKVYAERTGKFLRLFVRAMYDNTQEKLKEQGITHISLYRGMGVPQGQTWTVGTTVERARLQPINSWSTAKVTANNFKHGGRMLAAEVPIERILGSARTGFGCLNESEFVVLDTDGPVEIIS